ncbi:twin-arginine translocation signal domain-containing protein [Halosimplex halophilum]|uniref:twin-arginine translocation signal domain-containing protein n=1 Tax=Halosimplex halophilum TaxID=2559572 RepID=UPI00107F6FBC|nr:twin-arginine translocation signal domain-containing protein [Halosimplex halophilum]
MTDEPTGRPATGETSRRTFLKSGAVATGALAVGTGAVVSGQSGDDGSDGDGAQGTSDGFASVQFANQTSDGTSVTVDRATLSQPGYVSFHDVTLFEGEVTESVVGVSERLDAGVHYGVDTTLFDVPGADYETESLEGTGALVAMPHRETGDDDTYDFVDTDGEEDGPFVEADLPVVDLAFVVADGEGTATETPDGTPTGTPDGTATPSESPEQALSDTPSETPGGTDTATEAPGGTATPDGTATEAPGDDEPAPFATVDFENQAVTDDAVTVGEALLSEGGFVTLHDARLLTGETFASVVGVSEYLDPGRHRAVEVPLDDPEGLTEVTFPPAPARPLIPMPHLDTDDDESYDFVDTEGEDDGPYTAEGQAVVDLGFVTTEAEDTETGTGTETPTETGTPDDATDTPTETETPTDAS